MVEDLSVAAVDVVKGLDKSGVDWSLDCYASGASFALQTEKMSLSDLSFIYLRLFNIVNNN